MSSLRRKLVLTAVYALFGALIGIPGTGHAYLRRWRRSIVWFLLTFGTGAVLMSVYVSEPESIETFDLTFILEFSAALPSEVTIPIQVIMAVSVIDAVLIAFLDSRESSMAPGVSPDEDDADEGLSCPHCGQSTDPELDFCTWCTESLSVAEDEQPLDD